GWSRRGAAGRGGRQGGGLCWAGGAGAWLGPTRGERPQVDHLLPGRGLCFGGGCGAVGWVTSSCRAWGFLSVGGVGWWVGSPVLAAHGGSFLWEVKSGGLDHQFLPRMGVPFCGR